jgi:hypothetical protein
LPSSAICCSKLSHLYQTPSPLPVPRLKRRQIDRGAPLPPSPTAGTAARTCTPRLSCPFPARPGCIGGHISLAEQGRAAASPGARAHTRAQRRSRGRRRRDSAHLVEEHHVVVCLSSLRRGDNIGTVEGRCLRVERQHALFLWEVETAGRVHQLHKDEQCTVSPGCERGAARARARLQGRREPTGRTWFIGTRKMFAIGWPLASICCSDLSASSILYWTRGNGRAECERRLAVGRRGVRSTRETKRSGATARIAPSRS